MNKSPIKFKTTESELEILSILWNKGPSTVRAVNDEMSRAKSIGYTTTLKLMQIMTEKGLVGREMDGRTHTYYAIARQEDAQVRMLDRLLETAFGGSASKLVLQALGNHKTSEDELQEIKALIEKLEGEKS
jgi:BlaI family transcriptional regulator, penicillinase repressor